MLVVLSKTGRRNVVIHLNSNYIYTPLSTLSTHRPRTHHDLSASLNNPSRLILFGRSMGNPSARSQINCAKGPRPRETPKVAV